MKAIFSESLARGTVSAPPSKSMAHRALFCAAFSKGESVLSPVAVSEDMLATMDALSSLGATFLREGDRVTVKGMGYPSFRGGTIHCRESGSTLRFLIPLCLLTGERIRITGAGRLMARPLSVYEDLCREKGFLFEKDEEGILLCGRLTEGHYKVRGDISSQFITGLLFALSLLPNPSVLEVTGAFESASYVDMTLEAMKDFGKEVKREKNRFTVGGDGPYRSRRYTVEGDYSNAAFLDALSLVGGSVQVEGLKKDSLQGDRVYGEHFSRLQRGFCEIDLSDCPDLGPILFALAAYFHGARFTGTSRLAAKESDRGVAMTEELKKCGVDLILSDNAIEVPGGKLKPPKEAICGHNDHRIVMAMSVLLSRLGGEVQGAEAVAKSYPEFFHTIKQTGIEVTQYETE